MLRTHRITGYWVQWDAIGAIGEVAGATGVILSLLYLAIQIRGDAQAKRASTVHDQSNAYRDFLSALATDEKLADIYLVGLRDIDSLTEPKLVRFSSALGFLFRVFDEAYYHWNDGSLEEHVWHGFEAPMADTLAYKGVREWWLMGRESHSTQFREFIDKKIESVGNPKLYRD